MPNNLIARSCSLNRHSIVSERRCFRIVCLLAWDVACRCSSLLKKFGKLADTNGAGVDNYLVKLGCNTC
eukprot:74532-Pleurochrysis_carterae.AAC.2